MDMFLGNSYCTGDQERFQKTLKAGELEKALSILELMPHANLDNHEEELDRAMVQLVGYRELVRARINKNTEPLISYRQFGTPEEIAEKIKRLEEYETIGSLNKIGSISKYSV